MAWAQPREAANNWIAQRCRLTFKVRLRVAHPILSREPSAVVATIQILDIFK